MEHRGKIQVFSLNPLGLKKFVVSSTKSSTMKLFFPDKLFDAEGYEIRIIFFQDSLRMHTRKNGKMDGTDIYVINIIVKHLNATFRLYSFPRNNIGKQNFINALSGVKYDMTIDTTVKAIGGVEEVNIFETDGYCVLLPYPIRKSIYDMILKPFDSWTWLLVLITVACSALVWFLINLRSNVDNPVPTGYFIFAFGGQFLGQMLPFRKLHAKQKILLQLTTLLTFVLGNAYQSLIISYISDARYGDKIISIDEMAKANFTYRTDNIFLSMFESTDDYPRIKSRITGILNDFQDFNYSKMASENVAIVMSCSQADIYLNYLNPLTEYDDRPINFYYKLPDRFYTFYLNYLMTQKSLMGSRFQELVQRLFEAGIQQHWSGKLPVEDLQARKLREYYENEEYLLNLEDLSKLFYILIAGWLVSCFCVSIEIFLHDFLSYFKWRNLINGSTIRRVKVNFRSFKVIQVRPIESLADIELNTQTL